MNELWPIIALGAVSFFLVVIYFAHKMKNPDSDD